MPEVKIKVNAEGNASTQMKGLTKSMVAASLAVEGLKMATGALVNIGKNAVAVFKEQEKVEAQLSAVLESTGHAAGMTATEIKNMASSLQNVSTFGDEAILSGQNLLLTFTNVGKETFPRATQAMVDMATAMGTDVKSGAIQLGKALNDPIAGISALSRVGVSFTDDEKEMIRTMQEAGDMAGAQAVILKSLEMQFGGSAAAARDTFGGAMQSLKNVQGDIMEDIGRFISIMGKDFVNKLVEGGNKIREFINSADGIDKISTAIGIAAGIFQVFYTHIKQVGSYLKDTVMKTVDDVRASFEGVFDNMGEGIEITDILAAATKGVGVVFGVTGAIIASLADRLASFVKSAQAAAASMMALKDGDFATALEKAGEAATGLGNALNPFKEIVAVGKELKDQFSGIGEEVETLSRTFEGGFVQSFETFKGKAQEALTSTEELLEKTGEKTEETGEKADEAGDKFKDLGKNIMTTFSGVADSVGNVLSGISDAVQEMYDRRVAALEETLQTELDMIDENTEALLERRGLEEETKQEELNNEIDELQSKLNKETNLEKKAEIEKTISQKKNELERQKILDDAEKKKEAARKEGLKKQVEQEEKAFRAEKAMKIALIWINAAAAVIGTWAGYASLGIPGTILAAIQTAAILALAGVQTGMVASQTYTPPSFEEGGIVPGTSYSGDNIAANVNSGEMILTRGDQVSLLNGIRSGNIGGGGGSIINLILDGNIVQRWIINNRDTEALAY